MRLVRTLLITFDNSRGIRIPKVLIEQVELGDEVEIDVQRDRLVIRSTTRPRDEWE